MQETRPEATGGMTMRNGIVAGGIVVVMLVTVLVTMFVWPGFLNDDAYAFNGGTYEPPNPAAELALIDHEGNPFSLEDHRGKVVLLYFGYTFCPNYCPTTLIEMQEVKELLGDDATNVEVVMVTVDPARDTPARLKEYMTFFDPEFIGLSGTEEQINTAKMPYGAYAAAATPDANGSYLVDHSTSLYAIDTDGNLRLTWAYGTSPEDIAEDVEHLL